MKSERYLSVEGESNISRTLNPSDIGFLANFLVTRDKPGIMRIWDRRSEKFRLIRDEQMPESQEYSYFQQLKDDVAIAKRHGIGVALKYHHHAQNAYWGVQNQLYEKSPTAGLKIF